MNRHIGILSYRYPSYQCTREARALSMSFYIHNFYKNSLFDSAKAMALLNQASEIVLEGFSLSGFIADAAL